MALVVVRPSFRMPRPSRQNRRRPIERLDLALLIHAEPEGAIGPMEVQAHDVADLVDE